MRDYNRHPDSYHHWRLRCEGPVAHLSMAVDAEHPYSDGYELKLNSYDLGVDLELADAIQRVRFEHPEVRAVVVESGVDKVFCAGANITMLGLSSHGFKVNFCKFTNETRLSIEDASRHSGIKFLCAVSGPCAGGGYELALACDEIYLIDDNSSTVSLPEVPLLGVLPGTGGLTRLVDKRMVRRDRADLFSTLAEGLRGKRAKKWGIVDDTWPRSRFAEQVEKRASEVAAAQTPRQGDGLQLEPILPEHGEDGSYRYRHVAVEFDSDARTATITLQAPSEPQPEDAAGVHRVGNDLWFLRAFRELDDALLRLRFDHVEVGTVLLKTRGDLDQLLTAERALFAAQGDWLVDEVLLLVARVCRRYELTAKSFFALADPDSCFGGALLELAMASDRIYVMDDPDRPVKVAVGPLSDGALPMSNGLTRLQNRFLSDPEHGARLAKEMPTFSGEDIDEQGLATAFVEDLDWDDDVRIAIEERASLSPDALTGMEASLRFAGSENCDSKIFGRLSAWQNWIFIRPNATGERGALTSYGKPEQASFDWRRT